MTKKATKKDGPPRSRSGTGRQLCSRSGPRKRPPDAVGARGQRIAAATEQSEQTVRRRQRFSKGQGFQRFEELPTEASVDCLQIGELFGAARLPGQQCLHSRNERPSKQEAEARRGQPA